MFVNGIDVAIIVTLLGSGIGIGNIIFTVNSLKRELTEIKRTLNREISVIKSDIIYLKSELKNEI